MTRDTRHPISAGLQQWTSDPLRIGRLIPQGAARGPTSSQDFGAMLERAIARSRGNGRNVLELTAEPSGE